MKDTPLSKAEKDKCLLVSFLREELQKHWPCARLDASSKVSKDTTDLSKMKQASSSKPISSLQVFLYKTMLITWNHRTLHPQEDLLSLEFLEFVPVLSFQ